MPAKPDHKALACAFRPDQKLLPQQVGVTKAGVYGNENPGFFVPPKSHLIAESPGFKGFSKVGTGPAISTSTRTTKTRSAKHHNKNNTNRLTHNKNNTAEAQLTDSFGEALYLGLAPQPG
ncbi:hypothetical protein [Pseudomonas viridiflava]|uniref:hypothetical protein n=1 Tax=Pseudomonas viridiflava TaxID=33069 RepID=UPI0019672A4B|nr:hypothetical protein [Pseudomonas viridiflava]